MGPPLTVRRLGIIEQLACGRFDDALLFFYHSLKVDKFKLHAGVHTDGGGQAGWRPLALGACRKNGIGLVQPLAASLHGLRPGAASGQRSLGPTGETCRCVTRLRKPLGIGPL